MDEKKVILSIKDLGVKFHVRGRELTAIRGVSLDIYKGESIAIVGESGSGKSVFTKTFAGMLDSNGFVSDGSIVLNDDTLSDTVVAYDEKTKGYVQKCWEQLNEASKLEFGAETYNKMQALEAEKVAKSTLSAGQEMEYEKKIADLQHEITQDRNQLQVLSNKDEIKPLEAKVKENEKTLEALKKQKAKAEKQAKEAGRSDKDFNEHYHHQMSELKAQYEKEITQEISEETKARNERIAKEIYLSCGRFSQRKRNKAVPALLKDLKQAMTEGKDLNDEDTLNKVFDEVTFRVRYLDETDTQLHGYCVLNLAKFKDEKDWMQVRGKRVATIFQDPMTSLNPVITIGKQITSVIRKHQNVSEIEARRKAIELMYKVGIPEAEKRFDDYPFEYSGGMRQRIVIAIALSCQPDILICDEPTTALDVTIQAQILKLIKDLQKEFGYTIVFITHDLGVVANIAERVAVMYAGQVVELGTVEEVFYDPRHPYTWAMLSALPQLATKGEELFSITGTPPSLYNKIKGDAFAPRNTHALKIDTLEDSPMFQVSETHWAKTWLEDPRAPKVEKPEIINGIHEKLIDSFNVQES